MMDTPFRNGRIECVRFLMEEEIVRRKKMEEVRLAANARMLASKTPHAEIVNRLIQKI
jgi:hypothetical protein